jgi:hypothetical protein
MKAWEEWKNSPTYFVPGRKYFLSQIPAVSCRSSCHASLMESSYFYIVCPCVILLSHRDKGEGTHAEFLLRRSQNTREMDLHGGYAKGEQNIQ